MKNRVVGLAQQGHDYLTIASMLNITVAEVAKAMKGEEISGGESGGGATAEAWKPLAPLYVAGNAADFGEGYQAGRYRKNAQNGRVELDGLVKAAKAGTMFTLPVGYRPPTKTAIGGTVITVEPSGVVSSSAAELFVLTSQSFSTE